MKKKKLNFIFINPNQTPEKQKRFQDIVTNIISESACKIYIEERNNKLAQNKNLNTTTSLNP